MSGENPFLFLLEPAGYILIALAVISVWYGAKRSLQFTSNIYTREVARETRLSMVQVIVLPIAGSAFLILVFYFLNIIFYLYLVIISIFSLFGVGYTFLPLISWILKRFSRCPSNLRKIPLSWVIGVLLGAIVLSAWYLTSFLWKPSWVLNDILAVCMAITGLTFVRVNSIKLSTVLLVMFFAYDIFWVFFSKPIFGENVMVKVATQIQLPIVLVFPRLVLDAGRAYAMLGLGDIVLPGVLFCFTYRYDSMVARAHDTELGDSVDTPRSKFTYFRMCLLLYAISLIIASSIAVIFKSGQPALLYIVPLTLGPVIVRGLKTGEFKKMWHGLRQDDADHESDIAGEVESGPEVAVELDQVSMDDNRASEEIENDRILTHSV